MSRLSSDLHQMVNCTFGIEFSLTVWLILVMDLKAFLKTMSLVERQEFAERCRTSAAHLQNIAYGARSCGEGLAIDIDRESGGKVTCETLRPDVDWAHLRNSSTVEQRLPE